MVYDYARVSTGSQSVAARVATLVAAGADKMVRVVASGAKIDCAMFERGLRREAE